MARSVLQLYQEQLNAELRKRALSVDTAPAPSPPDGVWRGARGPPSTRDAREGGRAGRGTHLAIYHHPQPWERIAGPRTGRGARRGCSPRPARRTAGRPAAGLMARPPVPAAPGAPASALQAPLPLSAPRRRPLGPHCSVPPGLPGSGRVGGVGRGPSPAPARCRCERRNPPRELGSALGGAHGPPPAGGRWRTPQGPLGVLSTAGRAHEPARARGQRVCVSPALLRARSSPRTR